jgi:hypothetical protein
MRYLTQLVGSGLILLTVSACGQQPVTSQPAGDTGAPSGSVSVPATTPVPTGPISGPPLEPPPTANPPGKPRLTVPEGSTPVPAAKIDAAALPEGYPREVWTSNGGTILDIRAQEGGCGHALGEATEQTAQHVVVNLSETKAQTGQMCTMDIRFPVISVALAAPLAERTVVLKTTPPK